MGSRRKTTKTKRKSRRVRRTRTKRVHRTRTRRVRRTRTRTRRFKGGYGCGSSGCPFGGLQQGGVQQGSLQQGGVSSPFVGKPFDIAHNTGNQNYYDSYSKVIDNDPQLQMTMNDAGYTTPQSFVGGYSYLTPDKNKNKKDNKDNKDKNKKEKKRVSFKGGFFPQDMVNLGRQMTDSITSTYETLNGQEPPVSSLPYKNQLS